VAAVPITLVSALALWFCSDRDWRALEAYAAARGLSLVSPRSHAPPNPAMTGRVRALEAIAKSILTGHADTSRLPTVDELDEWTRALALHAEAVAQLESGCDVLPDTPFADTKDPWGGGWWRESLRLPLSARVATCPRDQLRACTLRLLRVVRAGPGSDEFAVNTAAAACISRMDDLRGDLEVAEALRALIEGCVARRTASSESMLALLANLVRDQAAPRYGMKAYGLQLSEWEQWKPLLALEVRSRRAGLLRSWIDFTVSLREHPDPSSWPWVYEATPWDDHVSALMQTRCWPAQQRAKARSLLRANLVLAELRGTPWPRDWFDPSGSPIRRIERDGRLIGAYSIGDDGVDGGGSRSGDICWPLYEMLGSPLASAALPADTPAGLLTPPRPAPAPSPRR
jgi:hypothetical protein